MHEFRTYIDLELYEFIAFLAGPEGDTLSLLNGFLVPEISPYIALTHYHMPHWSSDCPHDAETLDRGQVEVTLTVSDRVFLQASGHYASEGYFNAQDYLHGILNSRLIQAMTDYEDDLEIWEADWRPAWLRVWLDNRYGTGRYMDIDSGDDFPF